MRIQICGPLAVERDGQRLDALLPGRQCRLLFTYLVANRNRQVPRDELAEALWREPDPGAIDTRLNPLLSKLRRVLLLPLLEGGDDGPDKPYVKMRRHRARQHLAEVVGRDPASH